MHLDHKYGHTVDEIRNSGFKSIKIHEFENHTDTSSMDEVLAKTIFGFSEYIRKHKPDLVIVHGDRGEALAGSIAGSFNNILVGHIEGGELSGTIDELIRHSVSKMSHIHFVSNQKAKKRLIQMGEIDKNIHIIGSPDKDIMTSKDLPNIQECKERYDISFESYSIVMVHPVTTNIDETSLMAKSLFSVLEKNKENYLLIYPNNDFGNEIIFKEIKRFETNNRFAIFPSLRFEYFLTFLKNSNYVIGNSSCGIIEAPFYGIPAVNIGTRQKNRSSNRWIINSEIHANNIVQSIVKAKENKVKEMGIKIKSSNSNKKFLQILSDKQIFATNREKDFQEADIE